MSCDSHTTRHSRVEWAGQRGQCSREGWSHRHHPVLASSPRETPCMPSAVSPEALTRPQPWATTGHLPTPQLSMFWTLRMLITHTKIPRGPWSEASRLRTRGRVVRRGSHRRALRRDLGSAAATGLPGTPGETTQHASHAQPGVRLAGRLQPPGSPSGGPCLSPRGARPGLRFAAAGRVLRSGVHARVCRSWNRSFPLPRGVSRMDEPRDAPGALRVDVRAVPASATDRAANTAPGAHCPPCTTFTGRGALPLSGGAGHPRSPGLAAPSASVQREGRGPGTLGLRRGPGHPLGGRRPAGESPPGWACFGWGVGAR